MTHKKLAMVAFAMSACAPTDLDLLGGSASEPWEAAVGGGFDAPETDSGLTAAERDLGEGEQPDLPVPQPAPTPPTTYYVTSLADPVPAPFPLSADPCNTIGKLTPGTLRHAIVAANNNPNYDTIKIMAPGTIALGAMCKGLTIRQGVIFDGRADTTVTGPAMGAGTLLTVNTPATATVVATFVNLAGATDQRGIEVRNGLLDLRLSDIRDMNVQDRGAGILVTAKVGTVASLTLRQTLVENNQAPNDPYGIGAGIQFEGAGALLIENSLIRNNVAFSSGGGLGFAAAAGAPAALVRESTIGNNSAKQGGGVSIATTVPISFRQSTISHNASQTSSGAGLSLEPGSNITLDFVTLNENVSQHPYDGSAIFVKGAATVGVNSSLIIGRGVCGGPGVSSIAGAKNVWGDNTCPLAGIPNIWAGIGFLANNGGSCGAPHFPCLTNQVFAGHPAVDASNQCATAPKDQRGYARTGPLCWSGAYED